MLLRISQETIGSPCDQHHQKAAQEQKVLRKTLSKFVQHKLISIKTKGISNYTIIQSCDSIYIYLSHHGYETPALLTRSNTSKE